MIPCAKSELMLFDETPVQVAIVSSGWGDYHSITNPSNGGPLEFYIAGSQDEYLDLNDTKLYLQVKVEPTPDAAVCAPVNLLLSSLFQDVTISLNDVCVQGGSQLYPYKAMIESMLLFDKATKSTQLRTSGYYEDQAEHFNEAANTGFVERSRWVTGKRTLELVGPLHLDLMTQPRYILPQVDIRIRMTRHSSTHFPILSWDGTNPVTGMKINILRAVLYVRKVKTLPSVLDGHEIGLEHNNAIYPIQHVDMQTITEPAGGSSFSKENLFQGRMPKFVVVCMVNNGAFNGRLELNPFFFQHFNVSYCGLFRDGESIPDRTPYEIEDGEFARPYLGMHHSLELFNRNENNGITLHEYSHGNTFFVFNLTPDLVVGSGCQQPFRNGNIRLEMKFRTQLTSSINVIVYGVFDGKIEITKDRNIKLDYL